MSQDAPGDQYQSQRAQQHGTDFSADLTGEQKDKHRWSEMLRTKHTRALIVRRMLLFGVGSMTIFSAASEFMNVRTDAKSPLLSPLRLPG